MNFDENTFPGKSFVCYSFSADLFPQGFLENESLEDTDSRRTVVNAAVDEAILLEATQQPLEVSPERGAEIAASPEIMDRPPPRQPPKIKPGWDYFLALDVSPKKIDSSINPDAILATNH